MKRFFKGARPKQIKKGKEGAAMVTSPSGSSSEDNNHIHHNVQQPQQQIHGQHQHQQHGIPSQQQHLYHSQQIAQQQQQQQATIRLQQQQMQQEQRILPLQQQQRTPSPTKLQEPPSRSAATDNIEYVETKMDRKSNGRKVTTTTVHIAPGVNGAVTATAATRAAELEEAAAAAAATTDLTRNLVKKFIADIWNRGEIDLIPEVCSPSLRFNGNTGFDRVGHDGLARMVATIRDALDDYHCEIHSMVVEHNKAFCRLRFTGKHTGRLLGFEPTGKVVAWMGATEFTCQNGRILKVWELGDVKSLEEQLAAAGGNPAVVMTAINEAGGVLQSGGHSQLVKEESEI